MKYIFHSLFTRARYYSSMKFIDIGVNLTDGMYEGFYHGKKKHEPDLDDVLDRAWQVGLSEMIITGTSLSDSTKALEMCKANNKLFCTVGCHPTRCDEFETCASTANDYLDALKSLIIENRNKVVAVGECGLDYDRTNFCGVEVQKKYFEKQISLAKAVELPMFLHCRRAASDLTAILRSAAGAGEAILRGVVHSFDGTREELDAILDLDLFVGVNGCSLKTEENLEVASHIPLERLLLETDAPWCEIRPSHAGFKHIQTKFGAACKSDKWRQGCMVKSRNEPATIVQVLEVLSAIRSEDKRTMTERIYQNTLDLFFSKSALEK